MDSTSGIIVPFTRLHRTESECRQRISLSYHTGNVYVPAKNPDLRPESMWNYELAFAQRLLDGRLSYGINVFYIDGKI